MKTILIFAYYSYNDPVFQSAVLPYFKNFPNKDKYRFIILTFEQEKFKLNNQEIFEINNSLKKERINWFRTKWRSGKFKLFKKAIDLSIGVFFSIYLIIRYRISTVYSEGFPGAIISHFVCFLTRKPHLVHTFEPHADYMIESGVWSENSWESRLLRKVERRVARSAAFIFTATEAYKNIILSWGVDVEKVHTIPSCVDINRFNFSSEHRDYIRSKMKVGERDCVITYLGKFGGMYMEEELFRFFSILKEKSDNDVNFLLWIFTQDNSDKIHEWISDAGLEESDCHVQSLEVEDVPKYLAASDFGFVAVRQFPSKRYCSPIKNGEYWSIGLPIIIPENISDDFFLTEKNNLGIVLKSLERKEIELSVMKLIQMFKNDFLDKNRNRIREFAVSTRSVKLYQQMLDRILSING